MIRFLLGTMLCTTLCTGCSSPYLPHNAVRYIPEFQERGEIIVSQEPLHWPRTYFSPDSIRERYAQHTQDVSAECDPLLDIARESVEIMRRNGKSEDEIRSMLKTKFHFPEKLIEEILMK